MGLWSVMPTGVLTAINDAGAYYYACYLSINIGKVDKISTFRTDIFSHIRTCSNILWGGGSKKSESFGICPEGSTETARRGKNGSLEAQGPSETMDETNKESRG